MATGSSVRLEICGTVGLLRSVCVDADYRNQNIARQLCETIFQVTLQQGIHNLYLLTTTADQYLSQLGFVRIDQTIVPEAIQRTTQFSSLCPSSAIVMKRTRYV